MQKFRDWPLKYKMGIFTIFSLFTLFSTAVIGVYVIRSNEVERDILIESKHASILSLQELSIWQKAIMSEVWENSYLRGGGSDEEYSSARNNFNLKIEEYIRAEQYNLATFYKSSEQEALFIDELLQIKKDFLSVADELMNYAFFINNEDDLTAKLAELDQKNKQLTGLVEEEIAEDVLDFRIHEDRLAERTRWGYIIILTIVDILIVAFLFINFIIRKYVREPLKLLYEGTKMIAKKNFKHRIKYRSGDEIGEMCNIYNQATRELDKLYNKLETEVQKRTLELEEALKREIDREKEIARLKDEFVFIAAHELRSPVSAIRWSLEEMVEHEKTCEHGTVTREWIDNLQVNLQRLRRLVNDLLDVARIEYGTKKIDKRKTDIRKLVDDNITAVKKEAKEKNINIEANVSDKVPTFITTDPDRLSEILSNLLTNAVKFNKKGGKVWIEVEKKSKNRIMFSVKDNGIGMGKKEMLKLFDKFYRVENKETKNIPGTGLGLFITKRLVEMMEGKINVKSKKGEGSIFYFTLSI